MYNEVAYLIRKTKIGVDEYGDDIFKEEAREISVNIESVGRNEFYTAQTAGFNPTIIFTIADYYDYENQPYIQYDGVVYKIIRTYRKNVSLQIVCQQEE